MSQFKVVVTDAFSEEGIKKLVRDGSEAIDGMIEASVIHL